MIVMALTVLRTDLPRARRQRYVEDLAEVSGWDNLEAETCWGIFDCVQDAVEELASDGS
eukprot:COSAG02_NODE_1125_length_14435_cov_97.039411_4_plen_59_part_00